MKKEKDLEFEENTLMEQAYDLLEKAENASSETQAVKYAKKAYELCPDCFDAACFLSEIEDNAIKRMEILEQGLETEKQRLQKEGFFEEDYIGVFYGVFETRPYIRGLYRKAIYLMEDGKYTKSIETCKEILHLNESDNTGARYLLMYLYAQREDEESLIELESKYEEETFSTLFPMFLLYFKLEDHEKAKEYLHKINEENPNFLLFFTGDMELEENAIDGYYQLGQASEILGYFGTFIMPISFLAAIGDYALTYSEVKKPKKSSSSTKKQGKKKESLAK